MIFTRIAVTVGVVALGALIWLAVAGFKPAVAPLVTLAALVVLVAGGNWISSNFSMHHGGSPQRYAPEDPEALGGEKDPGGSGEEGREARDCSLEGRDVRELEE